MITVCHRMYLFIRHFVNIICVPAHFVGSNLQQRRTGSLITIQQTVNEIFVGNQVIDKFLLKNDELEIKGIFIHLPFLPLKRRYEKNRIVMYWYCPVTKKNPPVTFPEKEYLKKVGLKRSDIGNVAFQIFFGTDFHQKINSAFCFAKFNQFHNQIPLDSTKLPKLY